MKVNLICILLNFITRTKLKTSSVLITLIGITSQSAMRNNSSLNISETYNPMGDSNGYSKQELNYRIAIGVVNVFLCITAVFGNSAILLTIWKTSSLHLMANILLASLAVSDLAVGLVVQPLFIADLLIRTAFGSYVLILSNFLCIASLMTITAISADRLLALQLHLRYNAAVTPFRVTWVVFFYLGIHCYFSFSESVDSKLVRQGLMYYNHQHSSWKLFCLFENLPHCSTPSETDSTSTTGGE